MWIRRHREKIAWSAAGLSLIAAVVTVTADDEKSDPEYSISTSGTRWLESRSGTKVKMLVEQSNSGGTEVEVGEITFPAGYGKSPPHRHGSVEIFYVVSGKLGHIVNGEKHVIEPGMAGIVRPGDTVVHSLESDEPVRALVIWTPVGEADALVKAGIFQATPIEDE